MLDVLDVQGAVGLTTSSEASITHTGPWGLLS